MVGFQCSRHTPCAGLQHGTRSVPTTLEDPFLFLLLAALILAPVAHGCHGPDEDHEPFAASA